MKGKVLAFAVCFLALASAELCAGVLYARRPNTESPVYPLRISAIRTNVHIIGRLAVTHVDEEFFNDNNQTLEGFYAFQLPEGAKVNGLWLWDNGQRKIFICLKKEDAERKYDSVTVGTRRDPAILESLGANRFQLKVFPIAPNSSRRIEIQYFHSLPLTPDGYAVYRYPLNISGYQTAAVATTAMRIKVESFVKLNDLRTSYDDQPLMNRISKTDDTRYDIDFGQEQMSYAKDYELYFKADETPDEFPAVSWRDSSDLSADPYFIVWHPLPTDTAQTGLAPRDLVFVLDASGSMNNQRIAAVKQSMTAVLRALRSVDHFRLVLFSSTATSWPAGGGFAPAEPDSVDSAIDYINRYYLAGGLTDYGDAFTAGLAPGFRSGTDKRLLFLTDGEPTEGPQTLQNLLALISSADSFGVSIYPILFYTASIQLLYDIAAVRGGRVYTVEQGDTLTAVINHIIYDLDETAVSQVKIEYLNSKTAFVFPKGYAPYVLHSEIVSTGRYFGDGRERARLTWKNSSGGDEESVRDVDFSSVEANVKEIGAYWAAARIDDLLNEIRLHGEAPELKNSVIELSIKHSILSPYTAFLVLETNPVDPSDAEDAGPAPAAFTLSPAYPQPLSAAAGAALTIPVHLASPAELRVVITDLLGRIVRVLRLRLPAGAGAVIWDCWDDDGKPVAPGVYLINIVSQLGSARQRVLILR